MQLLGEVFCKVDTPKNVVKLTGKYLFQIPSLNKVAGWSSVT